MGRSNVVSEEIGLGIDVQQLEGIKVANNAAATSSRESFSRNNLPMIVCVIVTIAGDLLSCIIMSYATATREGNYLTLRTDAPILVLERVAVLVGMKVDLGFLMLDSDSIIVPNF